MVLRGRTSRTGAAIIACCLASAIWAGAVAVFGVIPLPILALLDSLRLAAWLLFGVSLVAMSPDADLSGLRRSLLYVVSGFCVLAVANDARLAMFWPDARFLAMSQLMVRIGFGVVGLLTIENLWRNTDPSRRWHVWPICLALGGMFAYELFLFSDSFITRGQVNPGLALGRPIVTACMAPLLALAMARNREWKVDIHVSREVVLHTATLVASGSFLLAVALVATVLRQFGGNWGLVLQLAMLIGSIAVLATVLSSGSLRHRLKSLISQNFYTHRYDYRVEWLKFIDLVSEPSNGEELPVRIIRALAEFVDSPAGILWSLDRNLGYAPAFAWKLPSSHAERVPLEDPFLAGFRDGAWIQVAPQLADREAWPAVLDGAWLAVPMAYRREIIGFVVLERPRREVVLDWEAFDLLRAAGRQAASYLAEERSTKALLDAELLNDYNKRFAFVIHDIKNLASQLGLVVSNARRYIDDPEFQRDMLQTVEDSVARMNRLLNQLKSDANRPPPPLDAEAVAAAVAAEFAGRPVGVSVVASASDCAVAIDADRLRSALTHLVQNAVDASQPGDCVTIALRDLGATLAIEVSDRGLGMDPAFIRDELFLPFRSTKSGGYGIGAFQTRELIRMSGGELDVISECGRGTTMRILLPLVGGTAEASAAA
jgi:putative PEP-CTERM system histidine kinase